MPAYVQHHTVESAPVLCPDCAGMLPMYVRDVEPHWNLAKIDFIYECSDCGTEVRHTVTRPNRRNTSLSAGLSAGPVTAPLLDHSQPSYRPLRRAGA
jgi:hypothetical protein